MTHIVYLLSQGRCSSNGNLSLDVLVKVSSCRLSSRHEPSVTVTSLRGSLCLLDQSSFFFYFLLDKEFHLIQYVNTVSNVMVCICEWFRVLMVLPDKLTPYFCTSPIESHYSAPMCLFIYFLWRSKVSLYWCQVKFSTAINIVTTGGQRRTIWELNLYLWDNTNF